VVYEVFHRVSPKVSLGYPIFNIFKKRHKLKTGVVGIEIEVEGNKFPKSPGLEHTHSPAPVPGLTWWHYVKDGSLRGADNAEYVLANPVQFEQVPEALEELTKALADFGSVLDDSNRTSVHVHLNCQRWHMNRVASFIALYLCFEEVLTEWCGEHRVGNLFCLRGRDAPGSLTKIKRFIQTDGDTELPDNLHYAGLNANALAKLGSLEVRSLRGPTDFSIIQQWVSVLERLYNLSGEFADPRDIPASFSAQGPLTFFETMLGDAGSIIRSGIEFNDDAIRDSMYEGIRLAQDICYCRDWGLFQPVTPEMDPFGRETPSTSAPGSVYSDLTWVSAGLDTSPSLGAAPSFTVTSSNEVYEGEPHQLEPEYDPEPEYDNEDD
jgi:hypothetical protein